MTFSASFSLVCGAFFSFSAAAASSVVLKEEEEKEKMGVGDPEEVGFESDLIDEVSFPRSFSRHPQTYIGVLGRS